MLSTSSEADTAGGAEVVGRVIIGGTGIGHAHIQRHGPIPGWDFVLEINDMAKM